MGRGVKGDMAGITEGGAGDGYEQLHVHRYEILKDQTENVIKTRHPS